jgi:hypothetical protein
VSQKKLNSNPPNLPSLEANLTSPRVVYNHHSTNESERDITEDGKNTKNRSIKKPNPTERRRERSKKLATNL